MIALIENRSFLQFLSLIMAIVSIAYTIYLSHKGRLDWRYTFIPMSILAQLIIFYSYVLVAHPQPNETVTFFSSVIRFEVICGYFLVLRSMGSE